MSILEILNSLLLKPLQLIFEVIYMCAYRVIGNPGLAIILLSIAMNFLVLPLYRRADALQEEERNTEARLNRVVTHIKKTFRGDERMMLLQTYYRQNDYKPTYVLRSAVSLLLEIPFFVAAYRFLSGLELLQGVGFGPIGNLGAPDELLALGTLRVNLLPIVMTVVNLVSCVIFTKGAPAKTKLQLYGMAVFFLFFLYDSPSGLVFYWTLNNVFSLVKTIFYKLKNPGKVLRVLASLTGLLLLVGILGFYHGPRVVVKGVVILAGLALQMPLAAGLLRKNGAAEQKQYTPNRKLFFLCAAFLALFIGAYIPLSVITASAQEFVQFQHFESPIWFVVSSFCLAAGIFVIWMGIFYWLAGPKGKVAFERAVWILSGVAVVDFLFFATNMGTMSSALVFDYGVKFSVSAICVNALVILLVGTLLYLAARFWGKYLPRAAGIVTLAVAVMIAVNVANVNTQLRDVRKNLTESDAEPTYTMSIQGRNVVIVMLDRGMGKYLPYIFHEKPELQEQFSGFTAYQNVVSTSVATNFATPALLGGYEYTIENINLRSSENLADKHNEALKVMPALFDGVGYDVTVFDPVYAGYRWVPDLSVFSDYPEVHRYITNGHYSSADAYERWKSHNMRNFFLYGLMKASPLALQREIYYEGTYNGSDTMDAANAVSQTTLAPHRAEGISSLFLDAYNVLDVLPEITHFAEEPEGSFLFMTNDTTHEPILLQEPDYVPSATVDNTEYDAAHQDRFTVDGAALNVESEGQLANYQVNMAAMLKLGQWFDEMRAHGAYDNTRIILVSDHGWNLYHDKNDYLPDGTNIESFFPILMVKDFDAEGFGFSEEFMTTADVPTLAMDGIIENPVNPFTGNRISSDYKNEHPIYTFSSDQWDVLKNNGTQFLPGDWYRVDNHNARDTANWVKVGTNTVLPEDLEN